MELAATSIQDNTGKVLQKPYEPGRAGLANISLGIAFLLGTLFSPAGIVIALMIDTPVLQSMHPFKAHLLTSIFNYWLLGVLVYLLSRSARIEGWIRPTVWSGRMFGIGNALLISYLAMRILASTVEGGGAGFMVASFSLIFVVPALVLFLSGLIRLIANSYRKRNESPQRLPFNFRERLILGMALIVPAGYISTLYIGEDAPVRLAKVAGRLMDEKCLIAGEYVATRPKVEIQSLFLEKDGGEYFENIQEGIYQASGGGIIGERLVNSGLFAFFEKPNDRPRREETVAFAFRRYGFKDWKGEPVNELQSHYGLFRKDLAADTEPRLGIRGAEYTIRDMRTNEVLARTTYFVSSRQRRFCGEVQNGRFDVTQFLTRALDLKRRFPSAWDKPPSAAKQ